MSRAALSPRNIGRRYKQPTIVLYPIAFTEYPSQLSGTSDPNVGLINESYQYPNTPTDTTYIFWDGPSDMGIEWKGFFGGLNGEGSGVPASNMPMMSGDFSRIDVCARGYGTKSAAPMNVYFKIQGKSYSLGSLPSLSSGWFVGTIFGNWSFEDFNKPAASADYTNGPYVSVILGGNSANKDGYVYNIQIRLYPK